MAIGVRGLAAFSLAMVQLYAWLALGSCFIRRGHREWVSAPVALLIGSGITAFLYSILLWIGQLQIAFLVVLAVLIGGTALGYRRAWLMIHDVADSYRELVTRRYVILSLSLAALVLYWVVASSPPRDADVMRYHLAHIRQIDIEGAWRAIAEVHYAMPFGWTLNYLPFEHLHIPEVAHFLSFGLLGMSIASLSKVLAGCTEDLFRRLLLGLVIFHPFLLKAGTTAFPDMYLILVVLAAILLVTRDCSSEPCAYGLLGFAAWIGVQSRYQAIDVGLSISLWVLFLACRGKLRPSDLISYSAGAGLALLLSSPFYLMNWVAFRNPFWPLLVSAKDGSYSAQVARLVSDEGFTLQSLSMGVRNLLTEPTVFPVPIAAFALIGTLFVRRKICWTLRCTFLIACVVIFWMAAQPSLYARFVMMLVPAVVIGWAPLLSSYSPVRWRQRVATGCMVAALLGFVGIDTVYARDSFAYLLSLNIKSFHHATWFYEIYDWANRSTPQTAKFLVIVLSGQSYYLDRSYRLADPSESAVINWLALKNTKDFMATLDSGNYEYIVYQDMDWNEWSGGNRMSSLIQQSLNLGLLRRVKAFPLNLVTLRIRDQSYPTTVWILARAK